MSAFLLSEDARTLAKITVAALFALWVGVRYYRVVKADEAQYRERRYSA